MKLMLVCVWVKRFILTPLTMGWRSVEKHVVVMGTHIIQECLRSYFSTHQTWRCKAKTASCTYK